MIAPNYRPNNKPLFAGVPVSAVGSANSTGATNVDNSGNFIWKAPDGTRGANGILEHLADPTTKTQHLSNGNGEWLWCWSV